MCCCCDGTCVDPKTREAERPAEALQAALDRDDHLTREEAKAAMVAEVEAWDSPLRLYRDEWAFDADRRFPEYGPVSPGMGAGIRTSIAAAVERAAGERRFAAGLTG
jgi:hypothetical protein